MISALTTPTATHVVIGLLGLAAGFLLGRLERTVQRGRDSRQRWELIARTAAGVLLIGLVVVAVVERDRAGDAQDARNECYRAYFGTVSQSLAERSAATGAAAESELAYLQALQSDRDVDAARAARIDALVNQETARRAAPLPQPPECP